MEHVPRHDVDVARVVGLDEHRDDERYEGHVEGSPIAAASGETGRDGAAEGHRPSDAAAAAAAAAGRAFCGIRVADVGFGAGVRTS